MPPGVHTADGQTTKRQLFRLQQATPSPLAVGATGSASNLFRAVQNGQIGTIAAQKPRPPQQAISGAPTAASDRHGTTTFFRTPYGKQNQGPSTVEQEKTALPDPDSPMAEVFCKICVLTSHKQLNEKSKHTKIALSNNTAKIAKKSAQTNLLYKEIRRNNDVSEERRLDEDRRRSEGMGMPVIRLEKQEQKDSAEDALKQVLAAIRKSRNMEADDEDPNQSTRPSILNAFSVTSSAALAPQNLQSVPQPTDQGFATGMSAVSHRMMMLCS